MKANDDYPKVAKRLLNTKSVDNRSDSNKSENYLEENLFKAYLETDVELYDDKIKWTKTLKQVKLYHYQSLSDHHWQKWQDLQRTSTFAVFTVKWFYKLKLSVENKRCEKCDQIFDNREKHRCDSQSFISTDIKFQYLSQFKYE